MRTFRLLVLLTWLAATLAVAGQGFGNPFYVFDNGAGRGALSLDAQAQLIKDAGYAGVQYSGTKDIPAMLRALDTRGLTMYGIYVGASVEGAQPSFDPGLKQAIADLKGRGTLIMLTVTGKAPDAAGRAVAVVREVADLAAAGGLRVALYPHYGFQVARFSEAVALAERSGRANVGVMFNLCHWLKEGEEPMLAERLKQAGRRLLAVSISGAEHSGDWDQLIQTLDRGDFDVYELLKTLRALGYKDPIGLQCYNIRGDRREILDRSMAAWRKFGVRAAAEGTPAEVLPGTTRLEQRGDLAYQMVDGINRSLERATAAAQEDRARFWRLDFSSIEAYRKSVEPNRERLRKIIGAVDARTSGGLSFEAADPSRPAIATGSGYRVYAVRWPVLEGVTGEGLLLEPDSPPMARVVAIPDADQSPEMLAGLAPGIPPEAQFARRLAESGCQVLVPAVIDRKDTWSGVPWIRMTNQPHREWIYRMAYEVGRTVIGYEVQRVLGAVDWFERQNASRPAPVAVAGYGEGGLVALFSAALDSRIDATLVSGYFQGGREIWREPIYRDLWGFSREFGDAEVAALVAPRGLVVEAARAPEVSGPPPRTAERVNATPNGALITPAPEGVRQEVERARAGSFARLSAGGKLRFVSSGSGRGEPGSEAALAALLEATGARGGLRASSAPPADSRPGYDPAVRLRRQFDELVSHVQMLVRDSPRKREQFWAKIDTSTPERWKETSRWYRDYVWDEVIGRTAPASLPKKISSRLIYDTPKFRGYEVRLDVWPDVFAYGVLLVPKNIKPGERRPAVVCQHGLEGRPVDVADPNFESPYYHRYAVKLAEEGFVTFAPQNPYIGEDRFRIIQRKGHPLKLALFSFILGQHQRLLEWLGTQPFVDAERIGFYGLSYGGKTAVRVPPFLDGYALSICSADFNEWVWKTTSVQAKFSYMFTQEYDMYEFDFANVVNYAELSWLMAPRPFMVERGHADGVSVDEWVAYEFARVRNFYATRMKLPGRTEIEFFDGPHSIHGQGTFEFLRKHLRWSR